MSAGDRMSVGDSMSVGDRTMGFVVIDVLLLSIRYYYLFFYAIPIMYTHLPGDE